MLVLCFGMQKSGSTLAFELVKGILESAGHLQPFLRNDRFEPGDPKARSSRNFIGTVTREKIETLVREIGSGRAVAVKTHGGFPDAMFPLLEEMQAAGALRVVASYRDPRDTCLSLLDAAERNRNLGHGAFRELRSLDDAAAFVRASIRRFVKWGCLHGTLRLGYDTVAFEPQRAVGLLEKSLGILSDPERAIRYAFESASTLKNRARRGRHSDELTPGEAERLTAEFRRFLHFACERDDQGWYDRQRAAILMRIAARN